MTDVTFSGAISWLGLICLWIAVIWQLIDWRKRKKEGTYEIVPKDSWWKQTYIWQVFFRRSMYRPIASSFPWVIFIIPAMLMVLSKGMIFIYGYPLELQKMQQVSGIVTKVHRATGKGSYHYIRVKDDSGNEETYRLCCFDNDNVVEEFKQKIQNTETRVDVWYENQRFLWDTFKLLRELKVNNDFIILNNKIYFQYDYQHFVNQYENTFPNLLWWLNYSLFGWLWLWYLNRKELPIHRLNKRKRYKKYNLKDK